MPVVQAEGLIKHFGDVKALCGVDFEVEAGTVLGVLGPNGAGKTTSVRILTTLLRPDGGRATIDGIDVTEKPWRVRARIGLTGQYAAVDERLTARENLELVGRFFRMSGGSARQRATELLDGLELDQAADRVVKGFSGGMRRRLDIAMSLVARPKVLFLDEPTTGLDPRSRLGMWDLIEELVAQGTTTVLTTQYLEEADRLADNIVVVDKGSVIARGTPASLKSDLGGERVTVTFAPGSEHPHVGDVAKALGELAIPGGRIDANDGELGLAVRSGTTTPAVVHALDAAGIAAADVRIERPTLDDVFLELTGHSASDDETETAGASK
jgi:ABC-2 type transport system ATP-binding protein